MPGIEGVAKAPMIASVAMVAFSCSDSNQRSRIGLAAPVRISIAFWPSVPSFLKSSPSLSSCEQVARRHGPGIGRRLDQRGLEEVRHPLQHRLVLGEILGVLLRELRDLAMGHLLVGPHQQVAAVGEGGEARRTARQHLEAVPLELQIADDLRTEEAVDVAGGGDLEAGPELFGDGAAAEQFAAFEDEHLAAGSREIGGGDQAVVAGADDDGVVCSGHGILSGRRTRSSQADSR